MWRFVLIIGAITSQCVAQDVVRRLQHPDEVLHEITEPSAAALTRKAFKGLTTSEVIRGIYPTLSEVPEKPESATVERIESLPQPEALRQVEPLPLKLDIVYGEEESPKIVESARTVHVSQGEPVIDDTEGPTLPLPEAIKAPDTSPISHEIPANIQLNKPLPIIENNPEAVPATNPRDKDAALITKEASAEIVPLPPRGISIPSELNILGQTSATPSVGSDQPSATASVDSDQPSAKLVRIEVAPQNIAQTGTLVPKIEGPTQVPQHIPVGPLVPPTATVNVVPVNQRHTVRKTVPSTRRLPEQGRRQIVDLNVVPATRSINNRPSISTSDFDGLRAIFGDRPRLSAVDPSSPSSLVTLKGSVPPETYVATGLVATDRQRGSSDSAANEAKKDFYSVYQFGYEVHTPEGSHSHEEAKTTTGRVFGSFSMALADGRQRFVRYEADHNGFHPEVHTNELGTLTSEPADTRIFSTQSLQNDPASGQSVFPFQLPSRGYVTARPVKPVRTLRRVRKVKASASASRRSPKAV